MFIRHGIHVNIFTRVIWIEIPARGTVATEAPIIRTITVRVRIVVGAVIERIVPTDVDRHMAGVRVVVIIIKGIVKRIEPPGGSVKTVVVNIMVIDPLNFYGFILNLRWLFFDIFFFSVSFFGVLLLRFLIILCLYLLRLGLGKLGVATTQQESAAN